MEWVIDGQRLLINVGQSMVSCTITGRTRTCNDVAVRLKVQEALLNSTLAEFMTEVCWPQRGEAHGCAEIILPGPPFHAARRWDDAQYAPLTCRAGKESSAAEPAKTDTRTTTIKATWRNKPADVSAS
jgi:hypothetical protein